MEHNHVCLPKGIRILKNQKIVIFDVYLDLAEGKGRTFSYIRERRRQKSVVDHGDSSACVSVTEKNVTNTTLLSTNNRVKKKKKTISKYELKHSHNLTLKTIVQFQSVMHFFFLFLLYSRHSPKAKPVVASPSTVELVGEVGMTKQFE